MNCTNRMYVFNEISAYEASKGERIIKAFEKLKSRIEQLEQTRLLEKRNSEKSNKSKTDLTMWDIKYEMLMTQLHYMIKLVREYPLDSVNNAENASGANFQTDINVPCIDENKRVGNIRTLNKETSTTNVQREVLNTVEKQNIPYKTNSLNHYHMKLDDVPFLLGASASASHSVVANVQNIIALMKGHNRALCSSKSNSHSDVQAKLTAKDADSQDPNKMLKELTEDLTKLTKKQEKLKVILDNAQSNHNERHKEGEKKRITSGGCKSKNPTQDKPEYADNMSEDSPIVPVVRKQNDNQLVRRRFLQSLRDFKTHLSQEDLSWK